MRNENRTVAPQKGQVIELLSKGLFLLILAILPASLSAQSTFGTVLGRAMDQSGAALAEAQVTLHSLDENTDAVTISKDDGNFAFENLKPGRYAIKVIKEGFSTATVNQLELTARQTFRQDVSLSVATQAQTVEVEAAAVAVNTENATLSDSKDNADITQLPINSRSVSSSPLAALAVPLAP